ncbi:MAG: GNAT family protein [Candidatus Zixiibacteriota bacterium]
MIQPYPNLETPRLILRGFTLADAPRVQKLAGDRAIAATTAYIPHPYPDGAAETWIATHVERWTRGEGIDLAVILKSTGELIGACGLNINQPHRRAEIGYWIGKPFWGQGYATETVTAVIGYGFSLGLNRIFAEHYHTNPASGRVLKKAGMSYEGRLRQHMIKWDEPMDMEVYGILASEWETQKRHQRG